MNFTPLAENWTGKRAWIGLLQLPVLALLVGVPLFVCNIFQLLGLVLIAPISSHAYRQWNYWIAGSWWTLLVHWGRHVHRWQIEVSGDLLPLHKSAIVISNHVEQPDILVVLDLALRAGSIGGLKFFAKSELRFVPGVGWGIRMLDFLLVKRAWSEDAAFVTKMFSRLVEYRTPIWVVSFPEGTRIKPTKLAKSQEFARKRGLPVFRNVMLPRGKGFVTTVERLRHRMDGVYDLTLFYPDGIPTIGQYFRGAIPRVKVHVRRHPMDTIPEDPEKIEAWLVDRFAEKDRFLENLQTTKGASS